MNERFLMIFNAGIVIAIVTFILFSWFYLREQFMWGIILVVLLLLFAGYVNAMRKAPWRSTRVQDAAVAILACLVLGFTWFYMREQFCLAGNFVIFLVILVELLKVISWLKGTVSIQVIIHKNEKDEERKDK